MPLHLAPVSRRQFLRRSALGAASLLTLPALRAVSGNGERWALLSDTHIASDPATIAREVNMAEHLRTAVAGVLALGAAPVGLIVNGDCSFDYGPYADYETFINLLQPLTRAGLPLHFTLGNHDERETFWSCLRDSRPAAPPLASRHVSVIEGARVNWFLLDSLEVTKQTPGQLGAEQRAWLAAALDARPGKPALVMVHHNPIPALPGKKSGLIDTEELLAILLPRHQVKALFFGHTHVWHLAEQDGLHLVNLPAVSYSFNKTELTGWIDCRLRDGGAALEIHASDASHPAHGKVTELAWRAA